MSREVLRALSRKPFAVVGHRGARGVAPENSLPALEAAIEAGADIAEFDVQRTGDGVLVASHDPVAVSDDGARIDIRSTSYEELALHRFRGERIPRIDEIVRAARGRIALFLEVKEPADTGSLVELLEKLDAVEYTAVISFYEEAVAEAKRLSPRIATGIIYFKPPGKITECKRLGCSIVLPRYTLATPRAVAFAHRLRLKVVAWTVNNEATARRLLEAGVDGIATDYPHRLTALRDQLAATPRRGKGG